VVVFAAASAAFAAAGIFPLGATSDLHIGSIALAFVLSVLGMYLAPSAGSAMVAISPRPLSWALAAGVALAVVLGHSLLPMGVGQRLAAACLLAWLAIVGVRAWQGMAATASGLAVPVLDEEHVRGPTA
jgi:hypothetical protein